MRVKSWPAQLAAAGQENDRERAWVCGIFGQKTAIFLLSLDRSDICSSSRSTVERVGLSSLGSLVWASYAAAAVTHNYSSMCFCCPAGFYIYDQGGKSFTGCHPRNCRRYILLHQSHHCRRHHSQPRRKDREEKIQGIMKGERAWKEGENGIKNIEPVFLYIWMRWVVRQLSLLGQLCGDGCFEQDLMQMNYYSLLCQTH